MRRPAPSLNDVLRRRHQDVVAANRWAASRPREERAETMAQLDAWAERINATCDRGAPVVRIGLTLHLVHGLRAR